jgi:hypothetical protein
MRVKSYSVLRKEELLSQPRNSPSFKKPEVSLVCTQEPAPSPYLESVQSSPRPSILFVKDPF